MFHVEQPGRVPRGTFKRERGPSGAAGSLRFRTSLFELILALGHHDHLAILTLALAHRRNILPISKSHVDQASISAVHRVEGNGATGLERALCDPLSQFSEKLLSSVGIPFDVDHHALPIWTDPRGDLVDEQLKRVDGPTLTRRERLSGWPRHLQHDHLSVLAFGNLEWTQVHSLDGSEQELADLSEFTGDRSDGRFTGGCGLLSSVAFVGLAAFLSWRSLAIPSGLPFFS